MATQSTALRQRFQQQANTLAQRLASGELSLDQWADLLRRELIALITGSVLTGTGGQRNADIDRLIQQQVTAQLAVLDDVRRLLANEASPDVQEVILRTEAFLDASDDAEDAGEAALQGGSQLPLLPIGAALAGLVIRQSARRHERLPRLDTEQFARFRSVFEGRFRDLADQLADGTITVDQWQTAMMREVRLAQGGAYTIGRGGIERLDSADRQRINQRVSTQFRFLERWANQLRTQDEINADGIARRANLYLDHSGAMLQEGRGRAVGLPVLPAYPRDGTTRCRTNCRCFIQVVRLQGAGNFDIFWRLSPAEHCRECLNRARGWSPIEVRNGVLQPFPTVGMFYLG